MGAKFRVDAFTRKQFCHCTSDHIMERENVMEKQGPLILKQTKGMMLANHVFGSGK